MTRMTKEEHARHKENPNVMLYEKGIEHAFRCDCGANVFHHPGWDSDEYQCNGCKSVYRCEKDEVTI